MRRTRTLVIWVLAIEAVVLLLGGMLGGHWKGIVYMSLFCLAWLGDQAFGRWASRDPELTQRRGRWALFMFAMLFAFYAGAQILAWVGIGEAW